MDQQQLVYVNSEAIVYNKTVKIPNKHNLKILHHIL